MAAASAASRFRKPKKAWPASAAHMSGQIVRYDDYMDPIGLARLLGRTGELAAALAGG